MTSKGRHRELARFGAEVLAILERDEDWGADQLDKIAEAAQKRKLCEAGENGLFKRTEEGYL